MSMPLPPNYVYKCKVPEPVRCMYQGWDIDHIFRFANEDKCEKCEFRKTVKIPEGEDDE